MKTYGRILGVLLLAATLSACTPASPQSGAPATPDANGQSDTQPGGAPADSARTYEPPVPVKDEARGMLPLDPYWGGPAGDLEYAAQEAFLVDCMHQAGFPEERIRTDLSAPAPEDRIEGTAFGQLFSEQLAAKYGYRFAPDPGDLSTEEDRKRIQENTEEYNNARSNCEQASWEAVPSRDVPLTPEEQAEADRQEQEDLATMMEMEANPDAVISEGEPADNGPKTITQKMERAVVIDPEAQARMDQAAGQWRECMAPLGIVDLPAEPWLTWGGRLPDSLMERWNIESLAIPDASAEEIEYAVHDAGCRRSSGWFDASYEAQWDAQERFIEEHRSELEPLLERFREVVPQYYEIIATYTSGQ